MSAKRSRDGDDPLDREAEEDSHGVFKKRCGVASAPEVPEFETSESDDLFPLLDLSSLTSESDISARFAAIAKALLHKYRIFLTRGSASTEYEILELEFYLNKRGCHEDPFTHGADEQTRSGNWYFHKAPRRSALPQTLTASLTAAGGYRGGTRKGLDLTFGMPSTVTSPYFASLGSSASSRAETSTVGGILIRCVADGRVISGPSLLVDEILRTSDAPSIASLVKQKWNDDISAFPATSSYREVNLWLKRRSPSGPEPKPPIHTSPRIGLDLSNPETTDSFSHPRVIYVARPYRFFTNPHLLTANGRWQTLYGLYKELLLSPKHAEDERAMIQKLAKLTGLKLPTVERFLDDYKQGYESGKLKSFIGSMGKGASASSSNYLRMMGTLDKAQNV